MRSYIFKTVSCVVGYPFIILFFAFLPLLSSTYAKEISAEAGKEIFQQNCSVCHGDDGNGISGAALALNPPPRSFTAPEVASELTFDRMFNSVKFGRPGTAMVAWGGKFSDDEIKSVIRFIRSSFMVIDDEKTATIPEKPVYASKGGSGNTGKELYTEFCTVCHGEKGNTAFWVGQALDPPPRNFTDPSILQWLTRERMFNSISNGRPGTAMVAWKGRLSQEQINSIISYVRTEFMSVLRSDTTKDEVKGASQPPTEPLDITHPPIASLPNKRETLIGDPLTGKALYEKNCVPCHGIEGRGNGPRSTFIFPKPRNFTDPIQTLRLDQKRIFNTIKKGVVGTDMPTWGHVLSDIEIRDITAYVQETFIKKKEGQTVHQPGY